MKSFKMLLLSIFCCGLLVAEEESKEDQPPVYDHVISLGDYCQVAWQLSLHQRRQEAYPFDWTLITFDGLYQFIANEGAHFLDPDKLIYVNNRPAYIGGRTYYIEDTVYGIQLLHDFECCHNFLKDYGHIKVKYDRRLQRFFKALRSEKKVLFVRRGLSYTQAVLLDELIHSKYPQLSYIIVALDETDEIKDDWGLERVRNFYLKETDPWDWVGDTNRWLEILNPFNFEAIQNPDPLDDHENR